MDACSVALGNMYCVQYSIAPLTEKKVCSWIKKTYLLFVKSKLNKRMFWQLLY
jgi:hypothetical protein